MLRELRIRDLAIIEDLSVEFGPGLNVLSGETGAGKSIILGALGLVLGNRASSDSVRAGRPAAEVQARFDRDPDVDAVLARLDIVPDDEDDGLLIRRVVTRAGRSRAYVGGAAVPVASLRSLARVLVDYASQHEHQVLLDPLTHRRILDRSAALDGLRGSVAEAHRALAELLEERELLAALERERLGREEWLRHQVQELLDAALVEGEWQELEAEQRRLANAEDLGRRANDAAGFLTGSGGATETLHRAVHRLRGLVEFEPAMAATLEGLESALIAAQEGGQELEQWALDVRANPRRLGEVDDRLAMLRTLARKHRCDVDALAALRQELEDELGSLEGLGARLEALAPSIADARAELRGLAGDLSEKRRQAAGQLARAVEAELGSLNMARASFAVRVEPLGSDGRIGVGADGGEPWVGAGGQDAVEFLLAANPGEPLRALSRVASGGELSRILLAARCALGSAGSVQVCVFDEIDAGIGGETADRVGDKLGAIAADVQVLCITHLPQIAARAAAQYRVQKDVDGGRTHARVVTLDRAARIGELVRMVAGSGTTEAAEAFAAELLGRVGPSDHPPS
jgi:DNA repair protein RecN (Recombination protein N)